jgi:hypothetical protein
MHAVRRTASMPLTATAARRSRPPIMLATMRANGVHSLAVTCQLCRHEALMNGDRFDDAA